MRVPLASATEPSCSALHGVARHWGAQVPPADSPGWDGDQFSKLSPMLFQDEVKIAGSALFGVVISGSVQVRATQEDALSVMVETTNTCICFFLFPKGRT